VLLPAAQSPSGFSKNNLVAFGEPCCHILIAMAIPRAIVLVDGENLVFRYEAMVESGRVPDKKVIHIPEVFVWHPKITEWCMMDIVHVYFYSSMVADDSGSSGIFW